MIVPENSGTESAKQVTPATANQYAKLGPGADVALGGPDAPPQKEPQRKLRRSSLLAAGIGVFAALVAANISNAFGTRHVSGLFSGRQTLPAKSLSAANDISQLDRMKPQQQAESLLELAVGQSDGALAQISARVDIWRGIITWNPRIANLTTAALNSNDINVRGAGIEVELAAYGLRKNASTVDVILQEANSSAHAQKIWALWTLGLLGNRGIETDRVVQNLTEHLKDSDEDSRRWAVEGLALVGTDATISPLLHAMHDDASPLVRERAACSLAQSGMLTPEQRMRAVPLLVNYSEDPALDDQTHTWAFQALGDITHQRLPNNSAAWRSWYASVNGE